MSKELKEKKELTPREVNMKVGLVMFAKLMLDKLLSKEGKKEDVLKHEPEAVMEMLNDIEEKKTAKILADYVSQYLIGPVKEKVLSKRRGDKIISMIEGLKNGLKGVIPEEPKVASEFGKIDYYLSELQGASLNIKLITEVSDSLQSDKSLKDLSEDDKKDLVRKLKEMKIYARILQSLFKENLPNVKTIEAEIKSLIEKIEPPKEKAEVKDKK